MNVRGIRSTACWLLALVVALFAAACADDTSDVADQPPDDADGDTASADTADPVETGLLTDQTLVVDGVEREFHVFVPAQPAGAPVVLLFHGNGGSHDQLLGLDRSVAPYRRWLDIAERDNVIAVAANGLVGRDETRRGWNDCRGDARSNSEADDVAFVLALIDEIVERYDADPTRVFAHGTSNGGNLTIRLAEEIPDRLVAIAPVVAANAVNSECESVGEPISIMLLNGTADPIVPYDGGSMINGAVIESIPDTIAYWVERNGVSATPVVEDRPDITTDDNSTVSFSTYRDGVDGTEVVAVTMEGAGHTDPSITERVGAGFVAIFGAQNGDIELADEVWAFFQRADG